MANVINQAVKVSDLPTTTTLENGDLLLVAQKQTDGSYLTKKLDAKYIKNLQTKASNLGSSGSQIYKDATGGVDGKTPLTLNLRRIVAGADITVTQDEDSVNIAAKDALKIATNAEATAGTNTTKAVSPKQVKDLIEDAKIGIVNGLSVVGRSANSDGRPGDITAGTDGFVLRRSGTAIGFGKLNPISSLTFPSNFPIQVVQKVKYNTQVIQNAWEDVLVLTITRKIASDNGAVRIQAMLQGSTNHGNVALLFRVLRKNTAIALGDQAGDRTRVTSVASYGTPYGMSSAHIDFIDNTPGGTAAIEYTIQAKMPYSGHEGYVNRCYYDSVNEPYTPRGISTLTLTELTP